MLFHVSPEKLNGDFIPRIPPPEFRLDNEDTTIPRICFSSSIDGCLRATCSRMVNILIEQVQSCENKYLYVYTIDETTIPKENLLTPVEVQKYVYDAHLTQEYWVINQKVEARLQQVIIIDDVLTYYGEIEYDEEDGLSYLSIGSDEIEWKWIGQFEDKDRHYHHGNLNEVQQQELQDLARKSNGRYYVTQGPEPWPFYNVDLPPMADYLPYWLFREKVIRENRKVKTTEIIQALNAFWIEKNIEDK